MQEFDVIIAGSGPAGATCAKALKDGGFNVLVLEKDVLPRHKTCSGVLFGQTQELLKTYFGAETPAEVFCGNRYIEADNIWEWTSDRGYIPYTWEIDKDGKKFSRTYHNIWRDKFDKWLLDRSGAPYCDKARVKGFNASGNTIEVEVQISGETDILRCQYLVGADGNDSTVRRLLAPSAPQGQEAIKLASFQSYFKVTSHGSLKKDGWTVFLEPEIGDYILCVHQKDEYLVLHVGGGEGRSLRVSMQKFKSLLMDRFGVSFGEHWRDEGCKCQLLPHFLGTEQVLLTGEAAGFIYLNCEGISAAMDSGHRCGTAIARALNSNGGSAAKLYADSCQDIIAHQEKCMSQMHFLAKAPPFI
jgi:flavin-dependent dehydrogenase